MNHLKWTAACAALIASFPVVAAAQPPDASEAAQPAAFQLSLWDSVQIVDRHRPIHGVRLSLPYGRNQALAGADVGIVGRIDGDLEGLQLSVAGLVDGDMRGLQYNWLLSTAGGQVQGAQWSAVNTAGSVQGVQLGLVNVTEGKLTGVEIGLVNHASDVEGFQLGLVNVTEHLRGVQVGLVNVARNGFLPVFVIFNAAL
jgi:hypothetical protein